MNIFLLTLGTQRFLIYKMRPLEVGLAKIYKVTKNNLTVNLFNRSYCSSATLATFTDVQRFQMMFFMALPLVSPFIPHGHKAFSSSSEKIKLATQRLKTLTVLRLQFEIRNYHATFKILETLSWRFLRSHTVAFWD